MATAKTSTLGFTWAIRPATSTTSERRWQNLSVDGIALSALFANDVVSPFGWGSEPAQNDAIDRLLLKANGDFSDGRVSLYVCPECGDLGCGAISVALERRNDLIVWRDFAFQNNYEALDLDGLGCKGIGPFFFDRREYDAFFDALRSAALDGGVQQGVAPDDRSPSAPARG
jgi:hypothetical protein